MKQRRHLTVFRKNMRVNNAVEMFLIEIINREILRNRRIDAVGSGNIVIERDGDENVQSFRNFGNFAEQNAVVTRHARSALKSRINNQNKRQIARFFRRKL